MRCSVKVIVIYRVPPQLESQNATSSFHSLLWKVVHKSSGNFRYSFYLLDKSLRFLHLMGDVVHNSHNSFASIRFITSYVFNGHYVLHFC